MAIILLIALAALVLAAVIATLVQVRATATARCRRGRTCCGARNPSAAARRTRRHP